MIPEAIILKILLSMPPFWKEPRPETPDARHARLSVLSRVISKADLGVDKTAAILTIGQFETHYALYVGEGRCTDGPFKCDIDKNGVPRARTYFQLWEFACRESWDAPQGSILELERAVRCAAGRWEGSVLRCRRGAVGGFSGYRSNICDWPGAKLRAQRYEVIKALIQGKPGASRNERGKKKGVKQ